MSGDKKDKQKNTAGPRHETIGSPSDCKPTYYHDDKPQVTAAHDVARDKGERRKDLNAGAKEPEKIGRVGANQYPGRKTPQPEAVKTAECEPGLAKSKADVQNASNRRELKD